MHLSWLYKSTHSSASNFFLFADSDYSFPVPFYRKTNIIISLMAERSTIFQGCWKCIERGQTLCERTTFGGYVLWTVKGKRNMDVFFIRSGVIYRESQVLGLPIRHIKHKHEPCAFILCQSTQWDTLPRLYFLLRLRCSMAALHVAYCAHAHIQYTKNKNSTEPFAFSKRGPCSPQSSLLMTIDGR